MSPSPRAAAALAAIALLTVLVGPMIGLLLALALAAATVVDALAARAQPRIERTVPPILARGVTAPLTVAAAPAGAGSIRVRQPIPPDLALDPREDDGGLNARLTPLRRGRHTLAAVAARTEGPLGLGRWHHTGAAPEEVLVYPDLPGARRLALAVRQGRFRETGRLTRGPLGLGTDFESIRDYSPDDDIRQINWRATDRTGRPMSNQYRVEQDREVQLLIDAGRLMAAPLTDRTRLDAAIDAAVDRRARRRRGGRPLPASSRSTTGSAAVSRPDAPEAMMWCARSSTSSRAASTPTTSSPSRPSRARNAA